MQLSSVRDEHVVSLEYPAVVVSSRSVPRNELSQTGRRCYYTGKDTTQTITRTITHPITHPSYQLRLTLETQLKRRGRLPLAANEEKCGGLWGTGKLDGI